MEGTCACGTCRFRVTVAPIVTHACHCTACQRETGSVFATNAVVESAAIELLNGDPVAVTLPSASGKGQILHRCPDCGVTLWSNYAGLGPSLSFIRVGTLAPGHGIVPDVHIYTSTRQPWVPIPDGARVFDDFYKLPEVWGPEGLARWKTAREAWGRPA